MDTEKRTPEATNDSDAIKYAGVAVDVADDEKVDASLVKEETKELNNNPRNTDL